MRFLKLSDKINIIKELEFSSQSDLAIKYGVTQQAISAIKKKREIYESLNCDQKLLSRVRSPSADMFTMLDSIVNEFCDKLIEHNIPIDNKVIKAKAVQVSRQIGLTNFKASNSWFDKFKRRHDLRKKILHGESSSVDLEIVANWIIEIPSITMNYDSDCIFNADESSFYWKELPLRSYSNISNPNHGLKQIKNRVSVLFCCNKFGGKEKLTIIGNRRRPHCFKALNYDLSTLNVNYKVTSSTYMTTSLFNEWLTQWNDELKIIDKKILLFVDNCPAHNLTKEYEFINIIKLPPNTTSHTQPLDCGIIANVKANYKSKLIQKIANDFDNENIDIVSFQKRNSLLNGIMLLNECWFDVKPQTVINCFKKAGFD